jgi:hypothetical protein
MMREFKKFLVSSFLFIFIFFCADRVISLIIEQGLEKYYGIGTNAEILINGASQIMLGLDKELIQTETGLMVSKYTREGVNVSDRSVMLGQFFRNKKDSLKVVVYGIDQFLFTGEGLSSNSYTMFYPFMDDPLISEYVKANSHNWYDYYIRKYIKCTRFDFLLLNSSLRGYRGDWSNRKSGSVNMELLTQNIKSGNVRHIKNEQANIDAFYGTMTMLQKKDLIIILLYIPYVDGLEFNDPRREETITIFKRYALENPAIIFYDLTSSLTSKHNLYFDPNHLNPDGQKVATEKLIEVIKQIAK